MSTERPFGAHRVRALEQALAILDVLADDPGLTVPEIAERVDMKTPNAHKLLLQLREAGLVEIAPVSERYRLGLRRLGELSARALANINRWEGLRQVVPRLQDATGMPGLIAVLAGGRAVYVEQFRGPARALGRAFPAHATALGKAILAFLDPMAGAVALSELVLEPWTSTTIVDRSALEADLARARARGYAIEDGELDATRRSVGAPVRDHTGTPIAAVGVGGLASALPDGELKRIGALVVAEARRVSEGLGAGPVVEVASRPLEVEVLGAVEPPVPPPASDASSRERAKPTPRPRGRAGGGRA